MMLLLGESLLRLVSLVLLLAPMGVVEVAEIVSYLGHRLGILTLPRYK
jgi:hypothetical protein